MTRPGQFSSRLHPTLKPVILALKLIFSSFMGMKIQIIHRITLLLHYPFY